MSETPPDLPPLDPGALPEIVAPPQGVAPAAQPTTLLRFLKDRDTACEFCHYNLRGITALSCPECGAVIPRPPEAAAREIEGRQPVRLYCRKCRHPLIGITASVCPECGEPVKPISLEDAAATEYLLRPPWPVSVLGVIGACAAVLQGGFAAVSGASGVRPARFEAEALASVLLAIPAIALGVWWGYRKRIAARGQGLRWILAGAALVTDILCMIAAYKLA